MICPQKLWGEFRTDKKTSALVWSCSVWFFFETAHKFENNGASKKILVPVRRFAIGFLSVAIEFLDFLASRIYFSFTFGGEKFLVFFSFGSKTFFLPSGIS